MDARPGRLHASHGDPGMKSKRSTMGSAAPSIDIGISPAERERIARGLSALLADSYTLYLMTHNFHWNVTGPMFNTLHLMFMQQYTEQWNALDLIAERIRALGHPAP
jgi:starvation-inducible DNA-binding protein